VTIWHGAESPFSPYDLVGLSYAGGTFVRLGLLAIGLTVLRRFAAADPTGPEVRMAALVAVLVLVLRPDVLYRSLPLSFVVGAALTLSLLLVREGQADRCRLTPPQGKGGPEQIFSLLASSTKARTDRERRTAAR
jgi:hypothetical protein